MHTWDWEWMGNGEGVGGSGTRFLYLDVNEGWAGAKGLLFWVTGREAKEVRLGFYYFGAWFGKLIIVFYLVDCMSFFASLSESFWIDQDTHLNNKK